MDTIHERWAEFREHCLPPELGSEAVNMLRRVFYCGVINGVMMSTRRRNHHELKREITLFAADMADRRV